MNITSQYLNKTFEIPLTKLENGIDIISHSDLENIILNECIDVTCHYTSLIIDEKQAVIICTISDSKRRIEAIGEANGNNLTSDIARMYPAISAGNRAFDRAAIKFLNLPGKIYSDSEDIKEPTIKPVTPVSPKRGRPIHKPSTPLAANVPVAETVEPVINSVAESVTNTKPVTEPVVNDKSENFFEPVIMEPAKSSSEDAISLFESEPATIIADKENSPVVDLNSFLGDDKPTVDPVTEIETTPVVEPIVESAPKPVTANTDKYDNIIVTIGRQKNKKWSIRQLAENDAGSLQWLATTPNLLSNPLYKEQAIAAKEYCQENGLV